MVKCSSPFIKWAKSLTGENEHRCDDVANAHWYDP